MFESQSSSTYHPAAARRLLIVLILCIFAATACAPRQDIQTLERAEALLDSLPDSSLTLLTSIEPPRRESLRALHAFLTAKARYKAYFDDDSDSTLMVALNYYTAHPSAENEHRLMECHFLRGIILENADNTSGAIISLLKAEKIALALHDNFYLGMIYRNIATLYSMVYSGVEQIAYAEKSREAFEAYGDSIHIIDATVFLAQAHNNSQNYLKCIELCEEAIPLLDPSVPTYSIALEVEGHSLVGLQRHTEAIEIYQKLLEAYGIELEENVFENLLACYYSVGDTIAASLLQAELKGAYPDIDFIPGWVYAANGNYEKAYNTLLTDFKLYEEAYLLWKRQSVAQSIKKAADTENEELQISLTAAHTIKYLICIICLIIIVSAIVIIRMMINHSHDREREWIIRAQELSTSLNTITASNSVMQADVRDLFEMRFSQIDRLCKDYYQYQGHKSMQRKVAEQLSTMITNLGNDASTLSELRTFANKFTHQLITDLECQIPDLKEGEIKLFLYRVLGFSPAAISLFLGEKIELIYTRKSRLKAKIMSSSATRKNEFLERL